VAWQLIRLALLARMLRNRHFHHAVAVGVIGLVVVARIGRENRATAFARLTAWDKGQAQRLERKAKQQDHAVKGGVRMIRSRATRGWQTGARPDQAAVPEAPMPVVWKSLTCMWRGRIWISSRERAAGREGDGGMARRAAAASERVLGMACTVCRLAGAIRWPASRWHRPG